MDKWIRINIRLFCRLSNFLLQGIQKLLLDGLDNCLRIAIRFWQSHEIYDFKSLKRNQQISKFI